MWEGQQRKQDINGRSSQFCWIYIAFEFWELSAKKKKPKAISISELKYVFSYCQIYITLIFHNTNTGFGFTENAENYFPLSLYSVICFFGRENRTVKLLGN